MIQASMPSSFEPILDMALHAVSCASHKDLAPFVSKKNALHASSEQGSPQSIYTVLMYVVLQ